MGCDSEHELGEILAKWSLCGHPSRRKRLRANACALPGHKATTRLWAMTDPRLSSAPAARHLGRPVVSSAVSPVNALEVTSAIVRHWRLVLSLPVGLAALLVMASYLMQPSFKAAVAFYPESKSSSRIPAGLVGLGAQIGLSLASDAPRSPRFFADVLTAREILERVLRSRYARPGLPGDSASLVEILGINEDTPAKTMEVAALQMEQMVAVVLNAQTGIIRLTVTAPDPQLAAAVANRFVELLNQFNQETLQSQARERRRFTERRLDEARAALTAAEDSSRRFLERNRLWQASPELQFEHDRLERQLQLRQEIYLVLAREYETARLDEVNDMSLITVVDPPVPPTHRSSPRRKSLGLVGLTVGLLLALVGVATSEYVRRLRGAEGQPYEELVAEVRQAGRQLGDYFRVGRRPRQ